MILPNNEWPVAADLLRRGGVGILRTDTLYGIVARASDADAVRRVYDIRKRDPDKACIVLIADDSQIYDPMPVSSTAAVQALWPGPVSIALPARCSPEWLPRFNETIAYRLPAPAWLRGLLEATGPLVAPSANPSGKAPARSVDEAYDYFGSQVDFYLDGGLVPADAPPSQLFVLEADGELRRLR